MGHALEGGVGWTQAQRQGSKDGVELGEKATQGGTTCWVKSGALGGKFKKHVSHTLKAES